LPLFGPTFEDVFRFSRARVTVGLCFLFPCFSLDPGRQFGSGDDVNLFGFPSLQDRPSVVRFFPFFPIRLMGKITLTKSGNQAHTSFFPRNSRVRVLLGNFSCLFLDGFLPGGAVVGSTFRFPFFLARWPAMRAGLLFFFYRSGGTPGFFWKAWWTVSGFGFFFLP